MAETAGLVVGVVALASLFNTAVECFEFVQLGRSFGKDFQTSQLKLDSARLRLSRWGQSLGLGEDVRDVTSLQGRFGSEANVKHAEALLGQIVELFADSEGVSNKYKSRASSQDHNLAVYNPQTDLEPAMAKLHNRMRQLAIDRQDRSSVRQKAKWALYQERNFRRLIEDITELVDSLVGLFPAVQRQLRELCDREVSAISEGEVVGILALKDIVAEQDKLLHEAIEQAINKTSVAAGVNYHTVFSGSNNQGMMAAHISGTNTFTFGNGGGTEAPKNPPSS